MNEQDFIREKVEQYEGVALYPVKNRINLLKQILTEAIQFGRDEVKNVIAVRMIANDESKREYTNGFNDAIRDMEKRLRESASDSKREE